MNQTLEWTRCGGVESCRKPSDPQFNVFEILRVAEELERKASRFYLEAVGRFADPQRRSICYGLAAWRTRRRQAWTRLRQEYSRRTGDFGTFDPDNYVLSNPGVMASLTSFATRRGADGGFTGRESPERIVRDAIRRARGAMVFYQGLKGFAENSESRMMIDNMIDEEQRYIRLLSRSLEQTQSARSAALS